MIEYIQKQVGYSIALFAFVLSSIAFVHFVFIRQYSILQILGEPSVSIVFVVGALVLLSALIRNTYTRTLQALLFYFVGLIPGLDAVPGNLNSAIFVGFALMLLIEYKLLKRAYYLKVFLFIAVYLSSIIYGFAVNSSIPVLDSIHTTLGLILALYLFHIMVDIRTMHHRRINTELEGLVEERTMDLKQKIREVEAYKDRLEATLKEKEQLIEEKNKLLNEKDTLIHELHHRTKNNMQLIQSLLDLEKDKIKDNEALIACEKTRNRIHAISVVHEYLYQSEQLVEISINEYIQTLLSDLWQVYYLPGIRFDMKITEDFTVPVEHVTPIGIILNELLCNAATHAFSNGEEGEIKVETKLKEGDFIILFRDTGCGMPAIERIDLGSTLGIELIRSLVRQLDGEYTIKREEGTEWELIFSLKRLTAAK
jgi:two-component sensor histidine kinase